MLRNIKSKYFRQLIFSHIKEGIKLNLVKYNKILQSELDICLNNYKLFTGRYIIYEKNGKTKEYSSFNDYLLFEGEYLNGKRNGKGKEYNFQGKFI